jgi:hypothetical protein
MYKWTNNFVEVSGHNLESSQTWGFCMALLNHRKGGMVFYQVLLFSPLQCTVMNCRARNFKRLREFAENKNLKAKLYWWLWIARRKALKTFVLISSKNSASIVWRSFSNIFKSQEVLRVYKNNNRLDASFMIFALSWWLKHLQHADCWALHTFPYKD